VRFAKLHGAGNDFLVFDGKERPELESRLEALVARFCHRRTGLGADGVLLLVPEGPARARVRYWNADGSGAAFCANGTRCAARFAAARWGWTEMVLDTGYAPIPATVEGSQVVLDLPGPEVVSAPLGLAVGGATVMTRFLVVGVPQLVVPVGWEDFWQRPLEPLAPALRSHPELEPGGANVNFVLGLGTGSLGVRSWERGVEGETLSCGSGDVAAALVDAERSGAPIVSVRTASGRELTMEVLGSPPGCPVRLRGPAEWVADGELAAEFIAPR
jgi:diaminopimelate epimerase